MCEIDPVEKLYESDGVTTCTTPAAIEHLFLRIDRKPIIPTTLGARAATLFLPVELDAAPLAFMLDADGPCLRHPSIPRGSGHDRRPSIASAKTQPSQSSISACSI